ncbi:MAG: LegC family aminotransferase [Lentisphaerae bacterium]|nr:LegC family aminotransferase [Lentisphaerota bacterium]
MIPLSVPRIEGNEWKYVKECLDTAWVSSAGSYVDAFEKAIAGVTGAGYAVACVNGTAALHVALRLAGVGPGDAVIVPTVTFIAPVNAVRYLGAEPVFMDCDAYYNLDAEKTAAFLDAETEMRDGFTVDRRTDRRITAMVPVHVFGNAADLRELAGLCRERNIKIVEDATESLGTRYLPGTLGGRHTGTVGEIGCLSFNGNKLITTGGGGMLLTDDAAYAERARYLTTQAKDDPVRYVHGAVGYNYRMTNVAAAIGLAQLDRLDTFCRIKRAHFEAYRDGLREVEGLSLAGPPDYASCNHWMYPLQIDAPRYGLDREGLMEALAGRGIETRPVWMLNHLQAPYIDSRSYRIERAHAMWGNTLNIPCSTGLRDDELEAVLDALRTAGRAAGGAG